MFIILLKGLIVKIFERCVTTRVLSTMFFLSIAFLFAISVNLTSEFNGAVDVFHQGEFIGSYWHMLEYYDGNIFFPLFIHGAMDYWPSLIAGQILGDGKIVFGTRLMVVLCSLISWVVFYLTGVKIIGRININSPLNICFAFVCFLMMPIFNISVMGVEEAHVGLRDLFLLLQTYFLTSFYISKQKRLVYLSLTFMILPATVFWSYDRGVASAVASLVLLLYFLIHREYIKLLVALVSLSTSIAFFEVSRVAGSVAENASNILYWIQNSGEIWGLPFRLNVGGATSLLPLLMSAAVSLFVYISWKNDKSIIPLGFFIFILTIEVFLLKSCYNRPIIARCLAGVWPAVLLYLWVICVKVKVSWVFNAVNINKRALQGKLLVVPLILFIASIAANIFFPKYSAFKASIKNIPTDLEISGEDLCQVAEVLKGDTCSLNMVNQGVITLLSKTSHCTKFPYLVYASKSSQLGVIEGVNTFNIKSVVIESSDWSSNIDGKSMRERLPDLYKFLYNTYTNQILVGKYIVLRK